MKPKIIVDAIALLSPLSGIGRYTYEVAKVLAESKDYTVNYYYGYFSEELTISNHIESVKFIKKVIHRIPFSRPIIHRLMFYISWITSPYYKLYWQPNFIFNDGIKAQKRVVTIHDFSWEIYPEFHPKERIDYFQKNFYASVKRCDHIITGSEFTKHEIIQRTGISSDKISVIYHGIDHTLFYPRTHHHIPKQKYILSVGSIEPRKNLKNLLLAYELLDSSIKDEYHLILVGAQGWKNDEIVGLMKKLDKWVQYSGFVSDEALSSLYSEATLFVYPSLYEGFGIPPLEAMACGTAVIVSNASTLPEVCDDAAFYVDPMDIEAIKNGILTVLNNEALREDLIQKGLQRAKEFSWEKSALEHQKVFEKVLFKG